ncbi:MAG: AMP-binding protein [Candidatus Obscuribacterales bacterium]|nr:AMP-binding protein [Cyanobacteria bacterium SZAS LIN-5]RTL45149.1 MAG: AMP-binding protein [Candidatus Melainabacteria bacterium]
MDDGSKKALLSYDHGISSEPLIGDTLGNYFEKIVAERQHADALVSVQQNIRYSYIQLLERINLCASGFLRLGIERGDRVGIWSTNNAEWIVTQLAAAKVGAILVNINPGYRTSELEYVLGQSGVKLLVVIPKHRTSNYLEMLEELAPTFFVAGDKSPCDKLPNLQNIIVIGAHGKLPGRLLSFDQVTAMGSELEASALKEREKQLQFDDPVNIQYTSGTTGLPKGVTLSHHNLLNNGLLAARAMNLGPDSRFCVPMPFYHCGGMISSALATISVGGAVVIPSPFYDDTAVLTAVQQEQCTHLSGVPTMFIGELHHPEFDSFDVTSLQGGFMAGAPCPVQLMRDVANRMKMQQIVILYGLTEASPLMTATTCNDSLEIRATTVGRVIPGIELKIVDAQTGEVVPRGVQGEICSRGHGVMLGYWNNPQATAEAIDKSGWLHSGDLGVMNADGFINITGRKKDMIIRGGENIYPREIEEVLHEHKGIAQAQVFGVPDARLGEEVSAWIMVKQGEALTPDEVREWLKERVAYFKVPKYVKLVSEFPMTVTGKCQKFVMRDMMAKELGLEASMPTA